jgi:hypothetical protein
MRMRRLSSSTAALSFALLIFAVTTSPVYCQQPFIRTSLCKALAHPARFDGKRVEFHAKYSGTFEGTWLTYGACGAAGELMLPNDHYRATFYGVDDIVTKLSKRYGIDDVVRDLAWDEFDSSSRRLYTGMTLPTADCCDYVTADFAGVLVIKRNFRVKNGFGNGWGHMGASRFLLVLRSVSDVSPHPCAGRQGDVAPPTLEFPQQPIPDLFPPTKAPH